MEALFLFLLLHASVLKHLQFNTTSDCHSKKHFHSGCSRNTFIFCSCFLFNLVDNNEDDGDENNYELFIKYV